MGFSSIWMSKSYLKCRYFDNNVISIVLAGFSKNGLNAFWKSAPHFSDFLILPQTKGVPQGSSISSNISIISINTLKHAIYLFATPLSIANKVKKSTNRFK